MALQIILLLNLLAYSFIISQSFSYIIALDDVQRKMQPATYIAFRQLVDKNFRAKFKYPFYASLLFSPATAVLALTYNNYFLFVSAIIATIAIVIDTIITIKKICRSMILSINGQSITILLTGGNTGRNGCIISDGGR